MSTRIPWSLVKGGFRKTPHFNSVIQRTAAGRRSSFSLQPYPTWDFEVDLNHVLGGEAIQGSVLQDFLGTFIACAGAGQPFYFTDPNDNIVQDGNLVVNGDFDSGVLPISPWTPYGLPVTASYSTPGIYSAGKALQINAANPYTGLMQVIDANPSIGATYKVSGWLASNSGAESCIVLQCMSAAGAVLAEVFLNSTSGSWQYKAGSCTCPQGTASVRVLCITGGVTGITYQDNVRVIKSVGSGGVMLNVTPGAATPMGTVGDGVSKVFQLARRIAQGVDIIQIVSVSHLRVNGILSVYGTDWSFTDKGVVAFVNAPPNNATLDWDGSFQYLCYFTEDTLKDLARVDKNGGGFLWDCSSITFESVL